MLVATDIELATADSLYTDVRAGLAQLNAIADTILAMRTEQDAVQTAGATLVGPISDAIGAVAGAVPAALSLLSTQRVVASAVVTPTDLAVAAAVAGGLAANEDLDVVYADFRLVPTGEVRRLFDEVCGKRLELATRKVDLLRRKQAAGEAAAAANAVLMSLQTAIAPDANQTTQITQAKLNAAARAAAVARIALVADWTDSLLTAIDEFVRAVRTVPTEASRSPLSTAVLHEELHVATEPDRQRITHALLVKSGEGQLQQLVDDRPLWFKDRFSTVAEVGVTYLLIETVKSHVVAAGPVSAVRSGYGTIGGATAFDPTPPSSQDGPLADDEAS